MFRATVRRTALASLLLAGVLATPALAADDGGWTENAKEAVEKAAAESKDLLINCSGSDWCGWCIRLEKEVFNTQAFLAEAPKSFVLLQLDYPRRKKQTEAIKKQNSEWRKKLPIAGFPTVFLTDATGKPYAKTGYRRGGPEPYLKNLAELRKARAKRDEAMAKAQTAEGADKAKLLDEALSAIDGALVMACYPDVVEEILKLDADGKAGLKSKYAAMALLSKVGKAMQSRQVAEAEKLIDEGLKTFGQSGQGAQDLLFAKSLILYRKKDKPGAKKALEDALKAAPTGAKAKQIKMVLARYFKDVK